jgi:hypothetical protein
MLPQQVRPVEGDNASDFVIDGADVVEALLDLNSSSSWRGRGPGPKEQRKPKTRLHTGGGRRSIVRMSIARLARHPGQGCATTSFRPRWRIGSLATTAPTVLRSNARNVHPRPFALDN